MGDEHPGGAPERSRADVHSAGGGRNGIPTGKPFYGLLRAYQPLHGAQLKPAVRKR